MTDTPEIDDAPSRVQKAKTWLQELEDWKKVVAIMFVMMGGGKGLQTWWDHTFPANQEFRSTVTNQLDRIEAEVKALKP